MSIITIFPSMPYFYAAMGYCDGEDTSKWHRRCPYDWKEELWRRAEWERRDEIAYERKKKASMAEKEEDRGQEVWTEEEEEEPVEIDPNAGDESIEDPEDPFNFMTMVQL